MNVPKRKFACKHCHKVLVAPSNLEGRRVKCPNCSQAIVLTSVASSQTTNPAAEKKAQPSQARSNTRNQNSLPEQKGTKLTRKQRTVAGVKNIRSQFVGKKTKKIRPSLLYMFSALSVCAILLLLIIGYFALIMAVGYATYYHAVNNVEIIGAIRGRGVILSALAYAAPIFAGTILVFFMFKPILARPGRRSITRFITAGSQPIFYAFVEEVCKSVNAPTPKKIYVDSEVNASASFKNGMLSLIFPADFSLTVGLPLVAGLRTDQLGGILAHEFGHFSQGGGMRVSYLIQSVNHWFARVALQRDAWDDWLVDAARNSDPRIGLLFMFAMLCVWISRMILIGFMYIAMLFSSFMLRRMEFNADQYEIQLVGSKTFEQTSLDMHVLGGIFSELAHDAVLKATQQKMLRNIPGALGEKKSRIDPRTVKAVRRQVDEGKGGLFDSHPSTRRRIARAKKQNVEGVYQNDEPATALFIDFDKLCEQTTEDFYTKHMGIRRKSNRQGKDWMVE